MGHCQALTMIQVGDQSYRISEGQVRILLYLLRHGKMKDEGLSWVEKNNVKKLESIGAIEPTERGLVLKPGLVLDI